MMYSLEIISKFFTRMQNLDLNMESKPSYKSNTLFN
jgi:hypothetical protein